MSNEDIYDAIYCLSDSLMSNDDECNEISVVYERSHQESYERLKCIEPKESRMREAYTL